VVGGLSDPPPICAVIPALAAAGGLREAANVGQVVDPGAVAWQSRNRYGPLIL